MSLYADGIAHATTHEWLMALLVNNARLVKRVEKALRDERLDPLAREADRARCLELVQEVAGVSAAALERRGKKRERHEPVEELKALAAVLQACDVRRDAELRVKIQNHMVRVIEGLGNRDATARLTVAERVEMSDDVAVLRGARTDRIGKGAVALYRARYHCRPPQRVVRLREGANVLAYEYTPEECAHTVDVAIQQYVQRLLAGDEEEEEEEEE